MSTEFLLRGINDKTKFPFSALAMMKRDEVEKKPSTEKILCAEYPIKRCFLAANGKIRFFFSLSAVVVAPAKGPQKKKITRAHSTSHIFFFHSFSCRLSVIFGSSELTFLASACVATLPVPRLRSLFLVTGWWRWVCDSSRNALNRSAHNSISFGNKLLFSV